MRHSLRACGLLSGVLLIVAAACHDAPTRPRLQSPLVGTWELTTQLDTFSFEFGPTLASDPDCPWTPGTSPNPYCTRYRTTTAGAYLAGPIEVRDTSSTVDTVTKVVTVSGEVEASFCDSVDFQNLTGCAHVGDRRAIAYVGQIAGAPDSPLLQSLHVRIGEPDEVFGGNITMRSNDATFAGDSIYGSIFWGPSGGRSPPTYRGTFVMRRVK